MSRKRPFDPNILNQQPAEKILWFDDLGTGNEGYRFLSNFYEGEPFYLPLCSIGFKTGEHGFQAFKATTSKDFRHVATSPGPHEAKAAGRSINLRADWDEIRFDVMAAVIRAKFAPDRKEAAYLLGTGDAYLAEGTFWHDTVWGIDLHDPDRPGRNWLGTLLMARRAELRALFDHAVQLQEPFDNLAWFDRIDTGVYA